MICSTVVPSKRSNDSRELVIASPSGAVTIAPPPGPRRSVTSPSDSSTLSASRSVARLTPNSSSSTSTAGRWVPGAKSWARIRSRSVSATSRAAFGTTTRAPGFRGAGPDEALGETLDTPIV